MSKVIIPPIKCQGIKSKLVPFIRKHIQWDEAGRWVEPFMGSGVVGFNTQPKRAVFADNNPHIINFYRGINQERITAQTVKAFLIREGSRLEDAGADYYYEVRERFNQCHDPLDFLFLSRAGFNGMIRFNRNGKFNVPFNHKPARFSKAYITKVVNQVQAIYERCLFNEWQFVCQDFRDTLAQAAADDFVYCDPPYAGRHVDYFNSWEDKDDLDLFNLLSACEGKFMLSTWHSNEYRHNLAIEQFWDNFHIVTREHFYHVGAKEENRNPVLEALVTNYEAMAVEIPCVRVYSQARLLEETADYQPN